VETTFLVPSGGKADATPYRDKPKAWSFGSEYLLFPVYFNKKYSSQPMSIFISEQLFTPSQEGHMLCPSWDGGIFFRVIKRF
jgi:hypothetical protein